MTVIATDVPRTDGLVVVVVVVVVVSLVMSLIISVVVVVVGLCHDDTI